MKTSKIFFFSLALGVSFLFGCKKEPNKTEKTKTEAVTPVNKEHKSKDKQDENTWRLIEIGDGQGHGPDPGSDEAVSAIAHRFIFTDESYQEDGFGLTISKIKKRKNEPDIFVATYMHRHYGDKGVFYTGQVEVKENQARLVKNSFKIKDMQSVLKDILYQALENDQGNTQTKIDLSSKITDILETEHQYMATHDAIQSIFQLEQGKMNKLWQTLSSKKTIQEWIDVLSAEF